MCFSKRFSCFSFSRLIGGYGELNRGGYTEEGLKLLTGGSSRTIQLKHCGMPPAKLFEVIHASRMGGSLLGCGIYLVCLLLFRILGPACRSPYGMVLSVRLSGAK